MAKIKQETIAGDLGRYNYDLCYSAKHSIFYATKFPDTLKNFVPDSTGKIPAYGKTEGDVKTKMRTAVREYEKTRDNWKLYIFWKIKRKNGASTKMGASYSDNFMKSLEIDYTLAYYNEVDGIGYYAEKAHYEYCRENNKSFNSHRVHGDYETGSQWGAMKYKALHTPELEAFFKSTCDNLGLLIDKVTEVLTDSGRVITLAANSQKLIG